MKRFLLFILSIFVLTAQAQVSVETSVDRIEMLVGEQAHVTLTAVVKENAKVEFPKFKPSEFVTPGVEVLAGWMIRLWIMAVSRKRWSIPSLPLTIRSIICRLSL